MLNTIYIARHGFRLRWIDESQRSNKNDPLSDSGLVSYVFFATVFSALTCKPFPILTKVQAQDLANHLASLPEERRPTAIFSSPYTRCLQTSQSVAIALGIPIYVDYRLSEWHSDVAGKKGLAAYHPPTPTELNKSFPQIDLSTSSWAPQVWLAPSQGETLDDIQARVRAFLPDMIREIEESFDGKHERILLVSHAAPVIVLIQALLADQAKEVSPKPGCCSLSELVRTPDDESWSVRRLDDVSYVSGDVRRWGFEDYYV
ncbi:phosphoglycerate mutase-like protein [Dendrothele bispora CBS 962.96]|uniref:Phosphoglycerate mutase-like protein n=1 Tax=Dendrothele bispora (strain CBS 962.96) TaxID=1314807 RepID=A0A4V6T5P0_DENBC|nr:phosphoglycerate mutase-like protein [Dendrothele bispora CBS 962.96]